MAAVAIFSTSTHADVPTTQPDKPNEIKERLRKPDAQNIELSPLVRKLLDDPASTPAERRAFAIFHGQWDKLTNLTPGEQAAIALQKWDLKNAVFNDTSVAALPRATAALRRGEPTAAIELLKGDASALAAVIKATALEQLGRVDEAIQTLAPWREKPHVDTIDDAAELTAAVEAMAILARQEGRPARDFQLAMKLLGKARDQIDRLYWPTLLAEARLLDDKDNAPEAAEAAVAALTLNPRAGEAWLLLGRLTVEGYDFERTENILKELRKINANHPLADVLETEMALTQKDAPAARAAVERALTAFPENRELLALKAAVEALSYQPAALDASLARFDQLAPGNPLAVMTVGRFLSSARQYRASEEMLRRAIKLAPNWPQPHVELGLLLMQSGDEEHAAVELEAATKLDPFNRRAANQLKLVQDLLKYGVIRTEHFIIKYQPGVDAVLARDMPEELETIYRDITGVFQHKPARVTLIEILPDDQHFGVRITGTPDIWTIAASTGDVIALTPPRQGSHQRGPFDWARVIRHEFVHTVTLDQTANRIPHWFTEACAVSQEPGGRDFNTARLLAGALQANQLFTLDQINWAFIRPKTPRDRPLAYAQAHWMNEYITATWGHPAIIKLLSLYREGTGNEEAITAVTGQSPADFLAGFKRWAGEQVTRWGLAKQKDDPRIKKLMKGSAPPDPATLAALLSEFPDHPDLLRIAAELAVENDEPEKAREAVMRYAAARPVDPWSDQMLVALSVKTGRPAEAIGSLEQLDRQEQETGAWAYQLAQVYRTQKELPSAAAAAERSLHREPYNATYRELATAIHLQRGDTTAALRHLEAMTLLEPEQAAHFTRLAALLYKLDRKAEAKTAAESAKKLDAKAPVERFLQ